MESVPRLGENAYEFGKSVLQGTARLENIKYIVTESSHDICAAKTIMM